MGFSGAIPGTFVRTGEERATLVRRTYGLVFIGIVVSAAAVAFTMSTPALLLTSAQHPLLMFIAMFATLWVTGRTNVYPRNVILTLLFTFITGVTIAPALVVAEQQSPGIIGQAGILTLSTFGILSLYAAVSRRDFSAWGSFFFIGLVVLIITSLMNAFFQSTAASLWIAAGTVLVFSGLLVFDTWRILRSGQYGPDDYVPAAINIFLDLLNLFLAIISLLGGGRRRN